MREKLRTEITNIRAKTLDPCSIVLNHSCRAHDLVIIWPGANTQIQQLLPSPKYYPVCKPSQQKSSPKPSNRLFNAVDKLYLVLANSSPSIEPAQHPNRLSRQFFHTDARFSAGGVAGAREKSHESRGLSLSGTFASGILGTQS